MENWYCLIISVSLGALKFSTLYKKSSLSMYGWGYLCGIWSVEFKIPHKISYPYIERCVVCWEVNILEFPCLRARRHVKRPLINDTKIYLSGFGTVSVSPIPVASLFLWCNHIVSVPVTSEETLKNCTCMNPLQLWILLYILYGKFLRMGTIRWPQSYPHEASTRLQGD